MKVRPSLHAPWCARTCARTSAARLLALLRAAALARSSSRWRFLRRSAASSTMRTCHGVWAELATETTHVRRAQHFCVSLSAADTCRAFIRIETTAYLAMAWSNGHCHDL